MLKIEIAPRIDRLADGGGSAATLVGLSGDHGAVETLSLSYNIVYLIGRRRDGA